MKRSLRSSSKDQGASRRCPRCADRCPGRREQGAGRWRPRGRQAPSPRASLSVDWPASDRCSPFAAAASCCCHLAPPPESVPCSSGLAQRGLCHLCLRFTHMGRRQVTVDNVQKAERDSAVHSWRISGKAVNRTLQDDDCAGQHTGRKPSFTDALHTGRHSRPGHRLLPSSATGHAEAQRSPGEEVTGNLGPGSGTGTPGRSQCLFLSNVGDGRCQPQSFTMPVLKSFAENARTGPRGATP